MSSRRLCVGVVAGAHGIRGGVRIKSFTAVPADVGAYGPVSDEAGARAFVVKVTGEQKGVVLAKLDGVTTRDAAEALKGMRLYVDRDKLPAAAPDEFYHADLIGLDAALADGSPFGKVAAVWDFGAGDSLEIERPDGTTIMVPFTLAAVPTIDLAGGRIVVDPPSGLFDRPEPPASLAEQEAAAAELLAEAAP
ncbi:MAG TPA: ribosome maturation factor RimM [Stellaceae bacterium]|nr:ribosome maturation factor RimM [Stellaceae bacterium]